MHWNASKGEVYGGDVMHKGTKLSAALMTLFLLCAFGAAACGAPTSQGASQPAGPTVHVTLVRFPFQQRSQTVLDTVIRDTTAVQRLYDAALALPLEPPGAHSCPEDAYQYTYHLAFAGIQGPVRTLDAGSCYTIEFVETHAAHRMDAAFYSLFTKTIGVTKYDPNEP
jgi:hypothetical protein